MMATHRPDGSGTIEADPLGTYPIFYYESDDLLIVSNSSKLLSDVAQRMGVKLKRSAKAYSYFITIGACAGNTSAYDDVKLLPIGSKIKIDSSGSVRVVEGSISEIMYSSDSFENLLDEAEHEIRENIKAIARISTDIRHRCDLTGGMDSRLVVSAILKEGMSERFEFLTNGSYPNSDANVAALVRETFSLRNAADRAPAMPTEPVVRDPIEAILVSLERANGLMEMNFNLSGRGTDYFSLSGGQGELFRTFWSNDRATASIPRLERRISERGQPFLSRHGRRTLKNELQNDVDRMVAQGVRHEDLGDAFYLASRNRYHFGIAWATSSKRFHPLYSPAAIRAATRLAREERKINRIGFELMGRWSPELRALPFADKSWSSRLMENAPAPITVASPRFGTISPAAPRQSNGSGAKRPSNPAAEAWQRKMRQEGLPASMLRFAMIKHAFSEQFADADFGSLGPYFHGTNTTSWMKRPLEAFDNKDDVMRANRLVCGYLWMNSSKAEKNGSGVLGRLGRLMRWV